jgi:hypothetical protein
MKLAFVVSQYWMILGERSPTQEMEDLFLKPEDRNRSKGLNFAAAADDDNGYYDWLVSL